jgi:RNA polymerase sigma factor (sigma-70 family)
MSDTTQNIVADLVGRWRNGDQQAADELFQRYTARLIALARTRQPAALLHRFDPEDVVQSAYRSFFVRARDGRVEVQPGADLWQLLVAIMLHKLQHQVRRNTADKRTVAREQHFGNEDSLRGVQAQLEADGPSPAEAAALADELERVMRDLDPVHRQIVELRLQGYNHEEIADQTQRSECTVRRVLSSLKRELEDRRRASRAGEPAEGDR